MKFQNAQICDCKPLYSCLIDSYKSLRFV